MEERLLEKERQRIKVKILFFKNLGIRRKN
jgi:hypothetical protein